MVIDISHADIGPELCQRCAACCRIFLSISGTDPRYRKFLRGIGYSIDPPPADGQVDCCDKKHDIMVDGGFCKHLDVAEQDGATRYRCTVYGKKSCPELCSDFDCVSWAKHAGQYNDSNRTLVAAQTALDRLRKSKMQTTVSNKPAGESE